MQDLLEDSQIITKDNFFLNNCLYVVSTPIGNIYDITLRAIDTLKKCDYIICEDSRISMKLLRFLQIKKPLIIYNDHSNLEIRKKIIDLIVNEKKSLSLISDAGTPLISDPGYKLVKHLIENNIEVKSVPGPCSLIAALSISGIESDKFFFAGFIPTAKSAKNLFFKEFEETNNTIIFFESAVRLAQTLQDMLRVFGNRKIAIAREITKLYEEVKNGSLEDLIKFYKENKIKGEIVILMSKKDQKDQEIDFDSIDKELKKYLSEMSAKDAVNLIADKNDINKKIIYQRMVLLKS